MDTASASVGEPPPMRRFSSGISSTMTQSLSESNTRGMSIASVTVQCTRTGWNKAANTVVRQC